MQLWLIVAKWILFWTVGIRSLSAGIVQLVYPEYTANIIFNLFLSANHILHFQAGLNEAVSLTGDLLLVVFLGYFLVKSYKTDKVVERL